MSNISVFVRLRPFLNNQRDQQSLKERVNVINSNNQIRVQLSDKREKVFKFDKVFEDKYSQNDIYQGIQMQKLIGRVVDGYHSTIFAYGQTGSGKTYTIDGSNQNQSLGLIPRSISKLFQMIAHKKGNYTYKVHISFLQIYNEQIFDLIDLSKKPLKMRWNKYQQFLVENLFQGQCRSQQQAINWWRKGQKNKIIDSHNMNKQSSRSHCLLTLRVKSYDIEDPSNSIQSKLQIVDLAGSQRQKVTKSQGVVFRQGIQINKSLFSLRQVISALYESNINHSSKVIPPYRDSKLTSLLKQSIGGNAYCAMIACLNPTLTHFQQSLQTLTYASMASYINNMPSKNIDPKIKQNEVLKEQNYNLKQQILKLNSHIEYLSSLLQKNTCAKCASSKLVSDPDPNKFQRNAIQAQKKQSEVNLSKLPKFNTNSSVLSKIIKKQSIRQNYQPEQLYNLQSIQPQQINGQSQKQKSAGYILKNPKQVLQSITMIKDLIHTNTKLRERLELMRQNTQKMQKEMFQIIQQNQMLRQRCDMVIGNISKVSYQNYRNSQNQAPIALYERMIKQQKGQGLKFVNRQRQIRRTSKTGNIQTQESYLTFNQAKGYNSFLQNPSKKKKQVGSSNMPKKKRISTHSSRKYDSFIN